MMTEKPAIRPVPKPGVLDIAAYVPGRTSVDGARTLHVLASNETPLGPSPRAVAAYRENGGHLEAYPDGSAYELRAAIGALYDLDPDRIVCGAGSDELLQLLGRAYLGAGDEAISTQHGFLMYRIITLGCGARPVIVDETELTADVDGILAAVSPRTRVVFLANPNNPTGTYLTADEVARLHAGLPGDCLLVIDAAYSEYVHASDYDNGLALARDAENVVMTRTFSKIYGLANLRVGWLYGAPHVADALHRIRGPFNLAGAAIAAGVAAIHDQDAVGRAVAHNDQWRPWLARELEALGLRVTPSIANFILVHFPDEGGPSAEEANAALMANGIVVRQMSAYGLPHALRITIGVEEANRAVVRTLAALTGGKAAAE